VLKTQDLRDETRNQVSLHNRNRKNMDFLLPSNGEDSKQLQSVFDKMVFVMCNSRLSSLTFPTVR